MLRKILKFFNLTDLTKSADQKPVEEEVKLLVSEPIRIPTPNQSPPNRRRSRPNQSLNQNQLLKTSNSHVTTMQVLDKSPSFSSSESSSIEVESFIVGNLKDERANQNLQNMKVQMKKIKNQMKEQEKLKQKNTALFKSQPARAKSSKEKVVELSKSQPRSSR